MCVSSIDTHIDIDLCSCQGIQSKIIITPGETASRRRSQLERIKFRRGQKVAIILIGADITPAFLFHLRLLFKMV